MAKKKVMLFIVEGPTDETSLSTVLNRIFSSATVKFQVIHGDILTRDFTSSDKYKTLSSSFCSWTKWACPPVSFYRFA